MAQVPRSGQDGEGSRCASRPRFFLLPPDRSTRGPPGRRRLAKMRPQTEHAERRVTTVTRMLSWLDFGSIPVRESAATGPWVAQCESDC